MKEREAWRLFSWHCPNCGDLVTGCKNREGFIKAECGTCRSVMMRSTKSGKHNCIDIFAPVGMEMIM